MAKCSECGFLTLREMGNGELIEVIDDYRVSGRIPKVIAYDDVHNYPICFVMAYDLMPEVEQAAQTQWKDKNDDWPKYVLGIIQKDRECPPSDKIFGFTKYQQGFTPKEHREMIDRERERKWHLIELVLIIGGNILAASLGALLVYLFTKGH